MDDIQLMELLWSRAEQAIDALAQEFGPRLYRMARNYLGSHEDAEETVNDTYLAVWNVIPPKRPSPLSAFVYRVGRNLALKRLRHDTAQKRRGYELSLQELEACIAGPDLWAQLDANALGQTLDAFLDRQNATSRRIFLRRYWFGDAVKDIAQDMGMTESAVSVRLSRTRAQLKAYLTKEGFYE